MQEFRGMLNWRQTNAGHLQNRSYRKIAKIIFFGGGRAFLRCGIAGERVSCCGNRHRQEFIDEDSSGLKGAAPWNGRSLPSLPFPIPRALLATNSRRNASSRNDPPPGSRDAAVGRDAISTSGAAPLPAPPARTNPAIDEARLASRHYARSNTSDEKVVDLRRKLRPFPPCSGPRACR